MGIIVDSDIEEIKYILMLGPDGFSKVEYMSQVLKWKAEGTTFAIRRLDNPINPRQSQRLRQLAKFFTTIDGESGKYKDLFTLQEDQLRKIELNLSETHDNKKKGGDK